LKLLNVLFARKLYTQIECFRSSDFKRMQPVMEPTYYYLVRKYAIKRSGKALVLEVESVFKIAVAYNRVREFLTSKSWEFQGKDGEMEMDSFRNKKTGKKV